MLVVTSHTQLDGGDQKTVFWFEGLAIPLWASMMLNPFPVAFFYWRDHYGVQWEMEGGRKRGYLRGILPCWKI
ncbi:hypothetical protein [Psychromonas ossibalaenae]|uniref:hypothetical protein n=1 Tax=Psychromonas ossibalaenae TaxID=444922 RepID=UPI000363AD08|nr:hypothetical protein [Psychromonas ossibalaenae]